MKPIKSIIFSFSNSSHFHISTFIISTLVLLSSVFCFLTPCFSQPAGAIKIATGCAGLPDFWVSQSDESTGTTWASSTNTTKGTTSRTNGQTNQTTAGSTGGAFTACATTTTNGKSRYLPSQVELVLMLQKNNILGLNLSPSANYWSSTEATNTLAWFVSFGDGYIDNNFKTNSFRVRCAWR